jgi:Holliday junction resolvase RusA-like endonuclease
MPPSANNLFLNVPHCGRVKSPAYRAWLSEAGWRLREQRVQKLKGPVGITISAAIPERQKRDLDNCFKGLCDLLAAHGIIEDDALIVQIVARWDKVIASSQMRCEVKQVRPPKHRMGEVGRRRVSEAATTRHRAHREARVARQCSGATALLRDPSIRAGAND